MAEVKKAWGKAPAYKEKIEAMPKAEPKLKVVNLCDSCRFTPGFATCKTCVNYKE